MMDMRLDEALNVMDQVATELEAAAALVGQRERTRNAGETPRAEALALTSLEAHGFAQILGLIAGQLRKAEADLRHDDLELAG